MAERSRYQDRIVRNYYKNRDAIALQRAQELVTELYLSTGKKRERHWEHLVTHLQALGMSEQQIAHLRAQDNPELVANAIKKCASDG